MVLAAIETADGRVTVCQPLAAVLVKVALARRVPVALQRSKDVSASVAGAAIELKRRNLAGHGGGELHPDLELLPVIEAGLCGCI